MKFVPKIFKKPTNSKKENNHSPAQYFYGRALFSRLDCESVAHQQDPSFCCSQYSHRDICNFGCVELNPRIDGGKPIAIPSTINRLLFHPHAHGRAGSGQQTHKARGGIQANKRAGGGGRVERGRIIRGDGSSGDRRFPRTGFHTLDEGEVLGLAAAEELTEGRAVVSQHGLLTEHRPRGGTPSGGVYGIQMTARGFFIVVAGRW